MRKYSLVRTEKKSSFGRTLYRVRAEAPFGVVVAGEMGGYVESEANLSQSGDAQVSGDAWVFGNAQVSGDARVFGGWVFAFKRQDWAVTEVEVEGGGGAAGQGLRRRGQSRRSRARERGRSFSCPTGHLAHTGTHVAGS